MPTYVELKLNKDIEREMERMFVAIRHYYELKTKKLAEKRK